MEIMSYSVWRIMIPRLVLLYVRLADKAQQHVSKPTLSSHIRASRA